VGGLEPVAIRDAAQVVGMLVGQGHVVVGWTHLMVREGIHRRHLVLLFPFHSSILQILTNQLIKPANLPILGGYSIINFFSIARSFSSYLEPYFDLPFCQAECMCNFNPPPPREVAIEMKFLFQLERLVAGVGRPLSLRLPICIHRTWRFTIHKGNPLKF